MPDDRLKVGLLVALFSWLAVTNASHAETACNALQVAGGSASIEVSGMAPAEDMLCYSLSTPRGQRASIEIVEGDNVIFTIVGVVDARVAYEFTTERKTYEVRVGQLMRSVREVPFRMRIAVAGTGQ